MTRKKASLKLFILTFLVLRVAVLSIRTWSHKSSSEKASLNFFFQLFWLLRLMLFYRLNQSQDKTYLKHIFRLAFGHVIDSVQIAITASLLKFLIAFATQALFKSNCSVVLFSPFSTSSQSCSTVLFSPLSTSSQSWLRCFSNTGSGTIVVVSVIGLIVVDSFFSASKALLRTKE